MRGQAMKRVISKLIEMEIPLQEFVALEFFARDGEWQTKAYSDKVKKLFLWEIDPSFEINLQRNFSDAEITIGDSFVIAHNHEYKNRFNFIVFDNPQGIFNNYCEHFEALELLPLLLDKDGIVIFNINKKPFNYSDKSEWKDRRDKYYKFSTSNIETKKILKFYINKLQNLGFKVKHCFEEKRNNEYLSYLVFILEK